MSQIASIDPLTGSAEMDEWQYYADEKLPACGETGMTELVAALKAEPDIDTRKKLWAAAMRNIIPEGKDNPQTEDVRRLVMRRDGPWWLVLRESLGTTRSYQGLVEALEGEGARRDPLLRGIIILILKVRYKLDTRTRDLVRRLSTELIATGDPDLIALSIWPDDEHILDIRSVLPFLDNTRRCRLLPLVNPHVPAEVRGFAARYLEAYQKRQEPPRGASLDARVRSLKKWYAENKTTLDDTDETTGEPSP
jgi:hypothetical protein